MDIPTQNILLIITFGEQSWVVLTNGTWQPVIDDFMVPDGVTQYTVIIDDISIENGKVFVFVNDDWLEVPNSVLQQVRQKDTQETDSTQSDIAPIDIEQQGDSYSFQIIQRTGDEVIAKSGFDTTSTNANVTSTNQHQSPESSDDFAAITVEVIESCSADGEIYDIIGTVDDVEDSNTVVVTVTDTDGNSLTFITVVIDSAWQVLNADLTGLVDGPLIVVANTADFAGNPATDSTQFIKDTLAQITISVDTGNDDVINNDETYSVDISGTTVDVEDNQTVTVTVTDGSNTLTFSTVVNASTWQINDADLSSLSDGELTYTATAEDLNCNKAEADTTTIKDTQASITIVVDTNSDTADNIINAAEQSQVDISGTVINIEDGQIVTLKVSDGINTLSFTAIVNASTWQVENADLSSLNDGSLSYFVDVTDLAGNPASAQTTTDKDTQAEITIAVDTSQNTDDNVINNTEVTQVTITGTVSGIEENQEVTVTVSDIDNKQLTFTTTIINGAWTLADTDLSELSDGELTYTATVNDIAGNPANAQTTTVKDTQAEITITVDSSADTDDEVINAAEDASVHIFGTTTNIEDGQEVSIEITNGLLTQSFVATVTNNQWSIDSGDLSQLPDGELTYTASVNDIAGNPAIAQTITGKDTQAILTIDVDSSQDTHDEVINNAEATQVKISGVATGIEDNQVVTVIVSDGNTSTANLTFTANVTNGTWTIAEADLSSLADGQLSYSATVNDVAGNPASAQTVTGKDTKASITIAVDSSVDVADETINAVESTQVTISGTTANIENGQEITVLVNNGVLIQSFTTTVNNNAWSIKNADISQLPDGELTYTASVNDVSGNPATAQTSTGKDTQAEITITVDASQDKSDNVLNAAEVAQVTISGTVTGVEDNQEITVIVNDKDNKELSFTTTVANGIWTLTDTDLSTLADGELTYTASVSDIAGNPTSAITTTGKDTQASITVVIDSGDDDYLIPTEMQPLEVSGTVTNVEAGQVITVTLIDEAGLERSVTTTVNADLTWQASANVGYIDTNGDYVSDFQDGSVTVQASVADQAGNTAIANDYTLLDTSNGITIFVNTFEDTFDQIINAAEAGQVNISGLVRNVEDGQTIEVTVSDGDSNTADLTFTTVVSGPVLSEWKIDDADLTSLNDGPLTFSVSVTDVSGNTSTADVVKIKDTQASIDISVDTSADTNDAVLNAAEVSQVTISGTVTNIENGQTISLLVTDGVIEKNFEATIIAGQWAVTFADLSGFADGDLTYTASVNDVAGNPTSAQTTISKDTKASISIEVDTSVDVVDETLNAVESPTVDIFGTTTNIENGQEITLIVSNGTATTSFTTTVNNNVWSIKDADLSQLPDGELTYTANVNDIAGNPATAQTTTTKDTQAEITITVDTTQDTSDNVLNAAEVTQVTISGTVTGVEDNQEIIVIVNDKDNKELSFTTTVANGIWTLTDTDLSTLADGELTYTASVNDIAGNPTSVETTTGKDTQASITVVIDSGNDEYLIPSEMQPLEVSGTVTNVEAGQVITITLIDEAGLARSVTTTVNADLTWQASANVGYIDADGNYISDFQDGNVTVQASVSDVAGNTVIANDYASLDTTNGITIFVNTFADTFDQVINAAEAGQVDISGLVRNVEVGQTITVTVSDGDSNTADLTFTTTVEDEVLGEWSIDDADLSSLMDGPLTFAASVTDLGGNTSTADVIKEKDTLASIDISVDTSVDVADAVLNATEISTVTITGTVSNIEDGQTVKLVVTDGNIEKSFNSTVVSGQWTITGADLSSLADGELTYTATVNDIAGNPATVQTTTTKDTQASVTIEVDTAADLADETINTAESPLVNIFGTTSNIENGQTITVIVSNGSATASFTTTVDNNTWNIEAADLSQLPDGDLTYIANVNDLAGNPATVQTTTGKDTQAKITITVDTSQDKSDNVLNAAEVAQVTISGTVTGVEDDQEITVIVSDKNNKELSFTASIINGLWTLADTNLSELADGELTYTASVIDIAGNPTTVTTTTGKDTQAAITVVIDSGDDDYLIPSEMQPLEVSGTVTNVEAGQVITVTLIDEAGLARSVETTVNEDLTWQASANVGYIDGDGNYVSDFQDGSVTVQASVSDQAGNTAIANDYTVLDTSNGITIFVNTFEDTFDQVINAAEANTVTISGLVRNVEVGQVITITVSDGDNNTSDLTFFTTVSGAVVSEWKIEDADLSSLNDGPLTFTASVTDLGGNTSTAEVIKDKDTQASIDITVDTSTNIADALLNAAEINKVTIAGTVSNIEDGQTVNLIITDGTLEKTFTTTVVSGEWTVSNADLSNFVDGELTFTASVNDVAGNPATTQTTTTKDTQAAITIDVDSSADFADETINAVETPLVTISGTVAGIEDNQTVTVVVNDNDANTPKLTFTTTVTNGLWVINNADLSGLTDGQLTYSASAKDIAGNPTTASTVTGKDTQAALTINVETAAEIADDTLNATEATSTTISGAVINIENGQTVSVVVSDGDTNKDLTFTAVVNNGAWQVTDADLSSLADGQLTYSATVQDLAGNPANAQTTALKDATAEITINVDTTEDVNDAILNGAEVSQVRIFGDVTNVEDGQAITLTVTDGTNEETFNTTVIAGAWSINDADLSTFADGPLTYSVNVIDLVGNTASAETITEKDTQAAVTIQVNSSLDTVDDVINAAEAANVTIFGTVTNIEDNQEVTIIISDTDANSADVTYTATVNNGIWSITNANLTSLTDGELTYTASVIDVAGNPASATTTTEKDTQAAITIEVDASADFIDNVINAVESTQVTISGTVTNVENDQQVTLIVSDGTNQAKFETTVINGSWTITDADLSGLADGTLTYEASVSDLAGNLTSAQTSTGKDTQATITVVIDSGDDNYLIPEEMQPLEVSGTVTNIEAGQEITITLIDEAGLERSVTTTVNADLTWQASANVGTIDGNGDYVSDFQDGSVTVQASVSDQAGNPVIANDYALLDTSNGITIFVDTFEDTFDQVINAAEASQVDISGLVRNVEAGQPIIVTVSDGTTELTFNTTVAADSLSEWNINDADLSSLNDGPLTFSAQVTDLGGNTSSAQVIKDKDTQATIDISVDTTADTDDAVINAAEAIAVTISGNVSNIEDGQEVILLVTDGTIEKSFTTTIVSGQWTVTDADLSNLADGQLTYTVSTTDIAGNPATAQILIEKDSQAAITIEVDSSADTADDVINSVEAPTVTIFGTVTNIEDNQQVTVIVSDNDANTADLSFTATVNNGEWSITNADLSSHTDGELTYTATVNDVAGNPTSAAVTTEKDTQANVTINVDTAADTADQVINAAEVTAVHIYGTTTNIEDGQTLNVVVTDGIVSQAFTTTVNNNSWSIDAADLTELPDADLTYTATVNDAAGNIATADTNSGKDTLAAITISVDTTADKADSVINAAEAPAVHIFGTTTNVENGQQITVIVNDGTSSETFTTVVDNNTWSIEDADLSNLADGNLTYTATVNDIAGNPATAVTSTNKDTLAEITINVDTSQNVDDDILNALEVEQVTISGTVSGIEDGQTITLVVSDGNTSKDLTYLAIINNSQWIVEDKYLAALDDGNLTFTATATDLVGNNASTETIIVKDTQAIMTIAVDTSQDTVDNIINTIEAAQVTISGTVVGIEDGQNITVVVSDGDTSKDISLTTSVANGIWTIIDADLSSLSDGELTYTATANDDAGNPATVTTTTEKDTQATITIEVDTSADVDDETINTNETPAVHIFGTTTNIENGQQVSVIVSNGVTTASFTAIVSNNTWSVEVADITTIADGTLTYTANVNDIAGNLATAETTSTKDTTAEISIVVDTNADTTDNIINAAEQSAVDISGTVTNVEDGREVTLTITDSDDKQLSFTTTVNASTWEIIDTNLSSLTDGELTYSVNVSDSVGNDAYAEVTHIKDTQADITIAVDTSADTVDNIINANEVTNVAISGTVTNIEDNQTVTITITDGEEEIIETTSVNNGLWTIDVDLSTLNDGTLTYSATVNDVAGNPTSTNTTTEKDTVASIEVNIDSGDDELLILDEVSPTLITGSVSNVEAGQTVSVVLTDSQNNSQTFTTTVNNDLTWSISPNLSNFEDGLLTAVATVKDIAGNIVSNNDTATIDTQVVIDIDTGENGIDISALRNNEITEFSGTTDAEVGQAVTVTITDGTTSLDFTGSVTSAGQWLVSGIDISGLSSQKTWQVTATVTDLAGNTATDDMPIIDIVQTNVFIESIVAETGSQTKSHVISLNNPALTTDSEITLSNSQEALSQLTSVGSTVNITVADDGQSLTVIRESDSSVVMEIKILFAAELQITIFEAVDNPDTLTSVLNTSVDLQAVQTDEDGTTEVVILPTHIEILDSPPVTNDDEYSVIENESAIGSLTGNDFTAEGPLTVTSVNLLGNDYAITTGSNVTIDFEYGQITVDSLGAWSFNAIDNLDNTVEQSFELTYDVIDFDGSTGSAVATFTIEDGKAGVMSDVSWSYVETDIDARGTNTYNFDIIAGSDTLLPDSIAFTSNTISKLLSVNLTSNGQALSYEASEDGNVITALAGETTVFTLTLTAEQNNDDLLAMLSFDQLAPIDHINNETLTLPLTVTAEDLDGTVISTGDISYSINDGANPEFDEIEAISIDEAELKSGEKTATGNISTAIGSDNIISVIFNNIEQQPVLTVADVPVLYSLSDDGKTLIGYTDDINSPVFKAELSDNFAAENNTTDGSYTFTLYKTLDEDTSDQIPLSITITDYDGDTTTESLPITLIDDDSEQITTPELNVSEIPVDTDNSSATNTDSGNITTTAGTDALSGLIYDVVDDAPVLDENGVALTQNGAAINWLNIGDGVLQGVLADGTPVFTVEIPTDFQHPESTPVDFSLLGPVDHTGAQADSLTVLIPIAVVDQDGTEVVSNMKVTIDDGLNPELISEDTAEVIDEGLLVTDDSVSTVGSYIVDSGSDEVVSVGLAEGYTLTGVTTQGGVAVNLSETATDSGWYVARSADDNSEVFRIRFNTNNTFNYKQSQAIDHTTGDGENTLTLSFDIQATDADGDTSEAQSVTITVKDDVPVSTTTDLTFIEGREVTVDLLATKDGGADGATVTQVTYRGQNYTVDPTTGVTITLNDGESGGDNNNYGTITIKADGSTVITTNLFDYATNNLIDQVDFVVTDADGDTANGTLNLTVQDGSGVVLINDASTNEDTTVPITIYAFPGDDDGTEDTIEEIKISIDSLNGGTLTLNGNPIPDDGSYYILSDGLITASTYEGFDVIIPNGILAFTPAENTSDAISDQQVTIEVSVTITDNVNGERTIESSASVTINSVADLPEWDDDNSVYVYETNGEELVIEDGGEIALTLKADLIDTDGSENLTFRIENINAKLTLTYNDGTATTVSNGDILTQDQLNTLSATSALNSAGIMTFDITAIATEEDNSDTAEQETKTITINIQPEADTPLLTVKDINSQEDVAIDVSEIITGELTDTDGSETLSFELTLPDGWSLNAINGASVNLIDETNNIWSASAQDIEANNIQLIPLEDISSVSGIFNVSVQAIAIDSQADGISVYGEPSKSDSKTLTVTLTGVIDPPELADTDNWDFDQDTLTVTNSDSNVLTEDSVIPLNFDIVTSDDDLSETISLTLTGLPDGATLLDSDGNEVDLPVVGVENDLPIYSVTTEALAELSIKPPKDFSGQISLALIAITTEADGASGEYKITLNLDIVPVIDEDASTLSTSSTGIEDNAIAIDFKQSLSQDQDGSEVITEAVITGIADGTTLTLDGSAYEFTGNLSLTTLADELGISLSDILTSGRLGLLPPQDATGTYSINIDYTIEDTPSSGDSIVETISSTIDINVTPKVELTTRFEIEDNLLLTSTDGSAIDLTGKVGFTDADIDGSETLDYVVILLPSGDNWLVTHPNGAIPDGNGYWRIPIDTDLTSDVIQENNVDILAGVEIISKEVTDGPVEISVYGRVEDGSDAAAILSTFQVQFDVAIDSNASPINLLQNSPIDGIEDELITLSEHLNSNIAGDDNDNITFRISASDLPAGVSVSGADVQIIHFTDGVTVKEYVFTEASLADLTMSSAGSNFAGVLYVPIEIIATDSLSGDTIIDNSQVLEFDIAPVVDGFTFSDNTTMQEDVPESLDLTINFSDSDLLPSSGGQEVLLIDADDSTNNLTIQLLDEGELIDSTGLFVLVDGTTDTYQFTGTTQEELSNTLSSLTVRPTEHLSGSEIFKVKFSGTVIDTATMLNGNQTDSSEFEQTVAITIEAVTDEATLTTQYSEGNEDNSIDLSALSAELIDQDGSETIYITINGVPAGAILGTDADREGGEDPVHLANNGEDGGSFNGQPTYSWTVPQAQLATLVLIPPKDFSGDIPLTLQAITKDEEPGVYVTTTSDFIVGINPIADELDVYIEPNSQYSGNEDDVITVNLGAETTDTLDSEKIQIKVNLLSTSDASALINIEERAKIGIDDQTADFVSDGSGGFYATLEVDSNNITSFDMYLGNLAWGNFDMSVEVSAVDTATVNGSSVTDYGDPEIFDFTLTLNPEVDAPVWETVDDITTSDPNNIPLNLALSLQNPASNEEGYLTVSGLPDGLTLNAGSQQGSDWLVDFDNVASLAIVGASDGDNFDLTLSPYAELDGNTSNGAVESINVSVNSAMAEPMSMNFSSSSSQMMTNNFEESTYSDNFSANLIDDMTNQTQGMDA
ncbi:hypothetical protein [Colwellia echini]|uniref:Cadherin domain-containing protein n=1 Tax=Colwellia echini TaxID=1982103 RepID=A0ABY3N0F0_9GAMM|nr:hypothetical protein [Colwellia echini]TYK66727.1 hypothetical protein CWS31_002700 [Colwellia echini]